MIAQAETAKKAIGVLGDASAQVVLAVVVVALCVGIFFAGRWVKNRAQEAWSDLKTQRDNALKAAKKAQTDLLRDTKERETAVIALSTKMISNSDDMSEAIKALTVKVDELAKGVEGLYED